MSFPRAAIAQVELLNAYLTELMGTVETFIDIKPFQKYLTTWPKAYILWESPSLMRQLIVRISKLHCEPSELLWKWSPGPLPKSPLRKGSPWQLRGLGWLTALLIDFGFENNSRGAGVWESEAEFDEADGTLREQLMRWAVKCPFPDPLGHDERWSGSHFYRDLFPPGCICRRWQPKRVFLLFGGKKKFLSFLSTNFQTATNWQVLQERR